MLVVLQLQLLLLLMTVVPGCSAWQLPHPHHTNILTRRDLLAATTTTSATKATVAALIFISSPTASAVAAPDATAPLLQDQSFATSAGRHGCTTVSDPSKTVVTCQGDLLSSSSSSSSAAAAAANDELRLAGIAATENGVSTSAIRNPSRYSPPWSYLTQTDSANIAWKSLQQALVQVEPNAEIQVVDSNYRNKNVYYLHATIDIPATGIDDVEFLLRPADQLVLYRSASRTSIFVFPLQQQVSDGNRNLKRMEKIRQALGWVELGYPTQTGSKRL